MPAEAFSYYLPLLQRRNVYSALKKKKFRPHFYHQHDTKSTCPPTSESEEHNILKGRFLTAMIDFGCVPVGKGLEVSGKIDDYRMRRSDVCSRYIETLYAIEIQSSPLPAHEIEARTKKYRDAKIQCLWIISEKIERTFEETTGVLYQIYDNNSVTNRPGTDHVSIDQTVKNYVTEEMHRIFTRIKRAYPEWFLTRAWLKNYNPLFSENDFNVRHVWWDFFHNLDSAISTMEKSVRENTELIAHEIFKEQIAHADSWMPTDDLQWPTIFMWSWPSTIRRPPVKGSRPAKRAKKVRQPIDLTVIEVKRIKAYRKANQKVESDLDPETREKVRRML